MAAEPATSQELVEITDPMEMVKAFIEGGGLTYEDPTVISLGIATRLMQAESIDELFTEPETWSSQDLVGIELEVLDVRLFKSRFNGGKGGFAACEVVRADTGERGIMSTSAVKVGTRLLWLKAHDALPYKVIIREVENETAAGHTVLTLESAA